MLIYSLYYSQNIPYVELHFISDEYLGQKIYTLGRISRIRYSSNATFFILSNGAAELNCVIFGRPKYELSTGELVIVEGKVAKYKNRLELIVEDVR